jgi:RNA polymerase sigma-70 factor, ECF subfamily
MPRGQGRGPKTSPEWQEAHRICLGLARKYASGFDAEDIAQEALLRAWRSRARLRDPESRGGWLRTIVRNEALRYRERAARHPVAEFDSGAGQEDDRLSAAHLRADLEAAVGGLEEGERRLIDLRYSKDMTQPAIARLLEVPEGTVKVRLHRARVKLHRALSEP